MSAAVRHFTNTAWVDEAATGRVDAAVVAAAAAVGARRKMLATGESGLYVQYSELPPGFRIDPHAHSDGEVLMVLAGSCIVDTDRGTTQLALAVNDAVSITAGQQYGITVGDEGMVLLTIRAADAAVTFAAPGAASPSTATPAAPSAATSTATPDGRPST